jgi:hypothetical protein
MSRLKLPRRAVAGKVVAIAGQRGRAQERQMKLRSAALLAALLLVAWPERSLAQITQADRDGLLALHDAERCAVSPPAASMPALVWDDLLAMVAQSYAQNCVFAHNASRTTQYAALGGSGYVGENIAMGTAGFYSVVDLAQLWADEKAGWTYDTVTSTNLAGVGHYTQMIWAATLAVGCGAAACTGDTFLVCDYAPGGNYIGQAPYVSGAGTNQACPLPEAEQSLGIATALVALAALRAGTRRAKLRTPQ